MDEHAYFRSIEDRFIQLRGAPLLLSAADYQLAKRWWAEGIPLAVIHGALEEVFARRAERGADSPVQSLRYCASAVTAAWRRAARLEQADRREVVEPIDVAARLEALAAAIPDGVAGAARLRSDTLALAGGAEEVEAALADLDRRLLEAADGALGEEARLAVASRVDRSLELLGERLSGAELEAARRRVREQVLRRELGLPVLSLFTGS